MNSKAINIDPAPSMDAAGSSRDGMTLPFEPDTCDAFSPHEDATRWILSDDSDDDTTAGQVDVP
eukprot:11259234-Karenia_brevis.AAC.1